MPRGTARNSGSSGEVFSHFNGVRLRVNGTGALKMKMFDLDEQDFTELADVMMSERTGIQPFTLANFVSQRVSLELKTVSINDHMRINRIILYSKFFATDVPQ